MDIPLWLWLLFGLLLLILGLWEKILSPSSGLFKFMSRIIKYFKPSIALTIEDGSIVNMIDATYNIPPSQNINWQIRYLQIRIASSMFNQMLSIGKIKCQIKDLRSGEDLNTDTYGGGYLYKFPLIGEKKDWKTTEIIEPNTRLLYCIPEICIGFLINGEYKLEIEIICNTAQNRKATAITSKKFIIKDNKGEWLK